MPGCRLSMLCQAGNRWLSECRDHSLRNQFFLRGLHKRTALREHWRLPEPDGMYMGNANIIPRQPRLYLYHAYLVYMEAHGYKNTLSLTMFGKGLSSMLKEYGLNYARRRTNQGMQTNLALREESNADWLPRCDETTAT